MLADLAEEKGSVFDPAYAASIGRIKFLRSLSRMLTRPVMPDDEAFEYIVTQAIADYLATEADPTFDGIVFPSAQASDGSANVVLFRRSARVETIENPPGTEVSASTWTSEEGGSYPDYGVIEWIPVDEEGRAFPLKKQAIWQEPMDEDDREVSLRLDRTSITVHHVEGVEFTTTEFSVARDVYPRKVKVPPAEVVWDDPF